MMSMRDTRIARALTIDRRAVVAGAGAVLAGTTLGRFARAQDATPAAPGWLPEEEPAPDLEPEFGQEFLFVQTFAGGALLPSEGATDIAVTVSGTPTTIEAPAYTLTLTGHIGNTVYFSDRPARIFGEAPTPVFLDGFGFDATNPPNAALVTTTDAGEPIAVVLELIDPVFDDASGSITYQANLLAGYDGDGLQHILQRSYATELPESFGSGSLFIDDCPGAALNCYIPNGYSCKLVATIDVGTCWSYYNMSCNLCSGPADLCNGAVPDLCNGQCSGVVTTRTQPLCP